MHATMPTKQRLWILNFALYQILVKKLGPFQNGRVSTFMHTVCICLVMHRNRNYGFSRAVIRVITYLFAKIVKFVIQV